MILNAVSGLGSIRIRKLIEQYGSALKVFSLKEKELSAGEILPGNVIRNVVDFPQEEFLKKEGALMRSNDVRVVTFMDENYPRNLLKIYDFPVVLYIKGEMPKEIDCSLAIVGSRWASLYGMNVAEQFAGRLSELGIPIVSGLAKGIDTAAHRGALKAGGRTIAVLGCGLNHIYPAQNEKLFCAISRQGAVVSEFPMDTPPIAHNFPRRNRIISGLSLGTIVVEAALKSGALITADCALEQGREVFAVPGKVDSPTSSGVHNLIKQGAKLITSIEDVLEELQIQISAEMASAPRFMAPACQLSGRERNDREGQTPAVSLTDEENRVFRCVTNTPIHIDELVNLSGLSAGRAVSMVSQLEIKKLIRQLPGKIFTRN